MPNPFETGSRKIIPAVLIYLRQEGCILMMERTRPPNEDYHSGKWNGLGGKMEAGESPMQTASRELKEETGIILIPTSFSPLGVLSFPLFKAHKNEDWLVFVLTAELKHPVQELKACPEGRLKWIPESQVLSLNLWPGDRHFLPLVLKQEPFVGTFWYSGQLLDRYELHRMGHGT